MFTPNLEDDAMKKKYLMFSGMGMAVALIVSIPLRFGTDSSAPSPSRGGAGERPVAVQPRAAGLPLNLETRASAQPMNALSLAAAAPKQSHGSAEEGAREIVKSLSVDLDPQRAAQMSHFLRNDPEMAEKLVALARGLLGSEHPRERARGLLILCGLGQIDLSTWQSTFLGERDVEARAAMIRIPATGEEESRERVPFLLERMTADPSPVVRSAAIEALPGALDERSVSNLLFTLVEDPSPEVRKMAATYFQAAGNAKPDVLQSLLSVASRSEEDTSVRWAALRALQELEEASPGVLVSVDSSDQELKKLIEQIVPDQDG